jgi:hypothetical protein
MVLRDEVRNGNEVKGGWECGEVRGGGRGRK